MKNEAGKLAQVLAELPLPPLPPELRERALARAHGQLSRPPEAARPSLGRALPAYAASTALLSADAVFVADACIKMGRAFGG